MMNNPQHDRWAKSAAAVLSRMGDRVDQRIWPEVGHLAGNPRVRKQRGLGGLRPALPSRKRRQFAYMQLGVCFAVAARM